MNEEIKKQVVFNHEKQDLWLPIADTNSYNHFLKNADLAPYGTLVTFLDNIAKPGSLQLGGSVVANVMHPQGNFDKNYSDVDLQLNASLDDIALLGGVIKDQGGVFGIKDASFRTVEYNHQSGLYVPSQASDLATLADLEYAGVHGTPGLRLQLLPTQQLSYDFGALKTSEPMSRFDISLIGPRKKL